MKQGSGIGAAAGAIVSSLTSVACMACCLPLVGAIGLASASPFLQALRPWLLGLSVLLVGFGFWQHRRAKQCAMKGRILAQVLLWTAVVVVAGMILFPQEVSGIIADFLGGPSK